MNKFSALILAGLLVTGCNGGGGSGGDDDDNGGGGTSLTIDSAPTAAFTASSANGSALATEIQEDVPDLVALATADLPGGINTLPGGVATTLNCADTLGGGSGSGTYSYDSNITGAIVTGSTITITYSNCTYAISGNTYTMNGSMTITYTRFVSYTDFATSTTYDNVTWSMTGPSGSYSYGPMNATYNINYANGTYTYSHTLSNGGASNISASNVIVGTSTVTITSATYVYTSAATGGVIKVVFDDWTYSTTNNRAVSGSITVTGANGNTVRIDATGTGYTITYTINSVVTAYTVTY